MAVWLLVDANVQRRIGPGKMRGRGLGLGLRENQREKGERDGLVLPKSFEPNF
jgi:hypothetical protein